MSVENPYRPSDIGSDSEQGLATAMLGTQEVNGGPKLNIEIVAPYIITEISRLHSPLYSGDSIGLEDKLIGKDLMQDKERAPENVANFFAERGVKMLRSMELLYGENFAARARALMRSMRSDGIKSLAPYSSPQGQEDRKILGILEQSLAGFVMELNADITPEAYEFRQRIYEEMYRDAGTRDPDVLLKLYQDGNLRPRVDSDFGYPKKSAEKIVEGMQPTRRTAWFFVRDLVKNLSDPIYRELSSGYSPKAV